MKCKIAQNKATRIRFLRRCGWNIIRLSKHFKMSREYVKKVCSYQVDEIRKVKK